MELNVRGVWKVYPALVLGDRGGSCHGAAYYDMRHCALHTLIRLGMRLLIAISTF